MLSSTVSIYNLLWTQICYIVFLFIFNFLFHFFFSSHPTGRSCFMGSRVNLALGLSTTWVIPPASLCSRKFPTVSARNDFQLLTWKRLICFFRPRPSVSGFITVYCMSYFTFTFITWITNKNENNIFSVGLKIHTIIYSNINIKKQGDVNTIVRF